MSLLHLLSFVATGARYTARAGRSLRGLSGPEYYRAAAQRLHEGAVACLKALDVTLRVEGTPPEGAALVVPNHFSLLDAFAVVGAHPMTVAGRADMQHWPIVGALPRTFGIIGVERSRKTATEDFVEAVQARLAAGVSVLVFAEGTTSNGRQLLSFKTGAFEAVAGTPYPVVPVWQRPVRDRHGPVADLRPFAFHDEPLLRSLRRMTGRMPAEVVVGFGAPIPAEGHTRKTLATEAEAAVRAMRREHGAAVE